MQVLAVLQAPRTLQVLLTSLITYLAREEPTGTATIVFHLTPLHLPPMKTAVQIYLWIMMLIGGLGRVQKVMQFCILTETKIIMAVGDLTFKDMTLLTIMTKMVYMGGELVETHQLKRFIEFELMEITISDIFGIAKIYFFGLPSVSL